MKHDIIGKVFGRLTVVESDGKQGNHHMFKCVCICGTQRRIRATHLINDETHSCGCLGRDVTRARSITHGLEHTNEYRIWAGIKRRCVQKTHVSFKYYGARGISVCERWLNFANFYKDMGKRPSLNHTVDRIDPSGNYEPTNCRWADWFEQQNNRRNTWILTWNGKTQPEAYWCRELGIRCGTIRGRLGDGWSMEEAFTIPVGTRRVSKNNAPNRR